MDRLLRNIRNEKNKNHRKHMAMSWSQRGQALPLGIALIMFGALLSIVLFNSGQLTSEKSRLANTADAAVYSGLIWQARALNFQAYTNRAMVANQVSIAQLVTMSSWTAYGRVSAENIHTAVGWIPPVRPFTQAFKEVMTEIDAVVLQISEVAVPIIDYVLQVLSQTQRVVHMATFAVTPALVKEVVEANDKRYRVDSEYAIAMLGQNVLDWQSFSRRYDDEKHLLRKADVIDRSRDPFTTNRDWKLGRFYASPVHRIELIKEGRTHLVYNDGEWAWMAKDHISHHDEHYKCSWRGCKWKHRETPIGWGAAYSPEGIKCQNSRDRRCQRWRNRNKKGERQANKDPYEYGDYSGVQAYYDLTDLSRNNKDPRLQLRVEVQLDQDEVRTSTKVGIGSPTAPTQKTQRDGLGTGLFRAEDNLASNTVAALSSGEIFFERPVLKPGDELRVRGREKQEYGNLFNPYWQVRLIDTTKEQRLAAWAVRSPDLAASAGGGVSSGIQKYVSDRQQELTELQELEDYARSAVEELPDLENIRDNLNDQVTALDVEVAAAESRLVNASDASESVQAQYQQQLADLQNQRDQIQSELDQTLRRIDSAQALAEQVDTYESLADIAETSLEQFDDSIATDFVDDFDSASQLAARLDPSNFALNPDLLIEQSQNQITDDMKEQFTESLQNALTDAATAILKQYGGNVYDEAEAAYDEYSTYAEEYYQNVIVPLMERIEEMRAYVDQVREQLQRELDVALETLQNEIDFLVQDIDNQVNQLTNDIENRIDELLAQRQSVSDPLVRDALDQEIAEQQARLNEAPQALRDSLNSQINNLTNRRDALVAEFDQKVTEVVGALEEDIAKLEKQLAELESAIPNRA